MNRLAACVALACAALSPALASAQTTVTVLGLQSAAADEDVARQMTDALRQAAESATARGGLLHTGRENDLGQLMIAFGCDEPDDACLAQISEGMNSQRLIFGSVERRGGRQGSGYAVTLAFFDRDAGRVLRSLQEVVPDSATSLQGLIPLASRYYTALTGGVVRGELAIRCAVSGATVEVNGRAVGTTGDEPIVLRDLEPGEAAVSVRRDGYEPFEQRVEIEPGQMAELDVQLEPAAEEGPVVVEVPEEEPVIPPPPPSHPRRSLEWLGWTTVGVGVVLAGLGLWSSLEVAASVDWEGGLVHEELQCWPAPGESVLWTEAALADCPGAPVGTRESGVDDVMGRIDETEDPRSDVSWGEWNGELDRLNVFAPLQFVLYGLSAVAVGIGIYVIVRERRAAAEQQELDAGLAGRLTLLPMVSRSGGSLGLGLSF